MTLLTVPIGLRFSLMCFLTLRNSRNTPGFANFICLNEKQGEFNIKISITSTKQIEFALSLIFNFICLRSHLFFDYLVQKLFIILQNYSYLYIVFNNKHSITHEPVPILDYQFSYTICAILTNDVSDNDSACILQLLVTL